MRLIFAGTPEFAAVALGRLISVGHEIVLVLTQPDRPSGRGLHAHGSAVKQLAVRRGLAVSQPSTLKDDATQQELAGIAVDAWVVAAYGLILPGALLRAPTLGCLNIHASLLPRWRGAAPIQRAIMAGDAESGISIMRMDEGLDTGPVYRSEAVAIHPDDTAGSLHDRLADLGADLVVEVLAALAAGPIEPVPQPREGVTHAAKIGRGDLRVDWSQPATTIERVLRALDPAPGCQARLGDTDLKLWHGTPGRHRTDQAPGTILDVQTHGIEVACGEGSLVLTELQRSGGRRLQAAEFLRGFPMPIGARFAA